MWFVLVLSCAMVAAKPSDKDRWNQGGPLNGEKYFPDIRPESGKPIGPGTQRNNFGSSALPEQMNPWNPDARPEGPAQGRSPFGQAFRGQNGGGNRGEVSEWTRSGSSLNQETWQWGASGKPQRSGRSGRPPFRADRIPVHPPQGPVGGGRENQRDQLFGKPLTPGMMDNRQFLPIFKADNVTLQNVSVYHLKEGENIFLLPKVKEQKQPPKGGVNRPQEMGYYGSSDYGPQPYVKLIYNPTATQRISFEYGITQLLPSFMKAESESN